ncbi:MAG: D-alanyl-D-alanine carboxypeptidase [Thermanaeromonas sp.]|uniref:D-alanyl-D-alanine carboxypeptidase family protein n=1 Tax=Thermanaeromonas sp. TaxID=2003697 RepID=UPI00243A432C|nr:D-alanyl-D-alanine carboxypeptidase family protein [Thermanaeromonas sp.]MCG0278229.1 D-alanyl-D-alanine carboxypeptidase [Thermanaeromonas sp.]
MDFVFFNPRRLAVGLSLCLLFICAVPALPAEGSPREPQIEAKSAVLMDGLTGQVLWSKNPHVRLPQASTTKITTAIVALERGNLSDVVRTSRRAAQVGEAAVYLQEGETLTLEELLYALLLRSANDAAVAIAEHIGGTEENFVALMNQKAREIGARDTHYVNPHGLHAPGHYSSAYDLALLARYALNIPKFREIVATREKVIPWPGKPWDRLLVNTNQLLWGYNAYPGADGVKTGYTREAGQVLVGSATREGRQLIAVVMHSPNMYREIRELLDYGFNHFKYEVLAGEGEVITQAPVEGSLAGTVPLVTARPVVAAVPREGQPVWEKEVNLLPEIKAPLRKGQKLGELTFILKGPKTLPEGAQGQSVTVDLVAARDVPQRPWWVAFLQGFLSVFNFPWIRLI